MYWIKLQLQGMCNFHSSLNTWELCVYSTLIKDVDTYNIVELLTQVKLSIFLLNTR